MDLLLAKVDLTLLGWDVLEAEVAEAVEGLVAVCIVGSHGLVEVKLAHFVGESHLHLLLVDIHLARVDLHLV
jgi:hypothetical protein